MKQVDKKFQHDPIYIFGGQSSSNVVETALPAVQVEDTSIKLENILCVGYI